MNRPPFFLLLFVTLTNGFIAKAQDKPDWINVTPISRSPDFKFFVSLGSGSKEGEAYTNAQKDAVNQLVLYLGARVTTETESKLEVIQKNDNFSENRKITEIIKVAGDAYIKNYSKKEEYKKRNHRGEYVVQLLYVMTKKDTIPPSYSHLQAGLRAVAPSFGQFYKRHSKKGVGILIGAGIVTTSYFACWGRANHFSQKANLYNTNPVYYSQYKQSQSNWENGMTGTLIAGGILYLYNVVDALATKGPRVYANHGNRWKLQPYYAANHGGISLSYKLNN